MKPVRPLRMIGLVAASGVAVALMPAPAGASDRPSHAAGSSASVHLSSSAASRGPLSPTDQRVHDRLTVRSLRKALGPDLAGKVTDALTGQVLWSRTPGERQLPASNTKLVTAVNALHVFGPDHRFTTRVVTGDTRHRVVLVGAGDPSLSRSGLGALAKATAAAVGASGLSWVKVRVDDSLFPAPSLAHGWKASYVPTDIRPVRALVVDQHQVHDTSMDAARLFAKKLQKRGVRVLAVRRSAAPAGATLVASVRGSSLASIVATMLQYSDNDYAEALHRLVAIRAGYAPTWQGARTAQRRVLGSLGVDLGTSVLYDGSGLSRADRIAPSRLVQVLSLVFDGAHTELASMQHNSLAIAGRTGTLGPRYLRYVTAPTKCAAGLVEAKTGSLHGVITLSGFARGADGRIKLFSFLLNRVPSTLTTRQAVDRLAATVTGCW